MEIQNKIGEQVFDKLRSKFSHITLGDTEGNSTQDPQEAVFFNFNYVDNQGHDHGNITVSLIDRTMKIYYSKNISTELDGSELTEWYAFLQDMRKTAMSNLYQFDTHDISKSTLDTADIQATVNRDSMKEGKMYGSKKRSYQDGPAKIIVRHTENINPEVRGSRSRKVESVFVETFEGERFKMPFNSLPGTRAMAQHIGQGGRPYDAIGESISTMVNEISTLRPFISRNRNAIYEDETTMAMIESAREYYTETRKALGKLKGKRGYKAYAESFEVTEATEYGDDTANSMKDRFTKKRFSDKMEAAMPVVHKAYNLKNMKPNTPGIKPITEFEEWAEATTEMPSAITEDCASILDDAEISQIKAWVNGQIEDLDDELFDKLFNHYLDNGEMPYGTAKARTGDPYQWMFDRMDQEYGRMNEAAEEMCSTECCGKPVSQCHCGPECPHCDCHEKNKLKEDEWSLGARDHRDQNYRPAINPKTKKPYTQDEWNAGKKKQVDEVKSGTFNSKMVGRKAKVHGQSSFGDSDYNGQVGEIYRASREHTFSSMVPFKVVYGIRFDDGETREYRRESVRPVKEASYNPQPDPGAEILDEGILQSVFDFMWNMTGKIPMVAKKRKSKQLAQEFARFKEKMDDATISEWLTELSSKVKSTHPATANAIANRQDILIRAIGHVKNAKSEQQFVEKMHYLKSELHHWKKFVTKSNKGVADRKRKAKFDAATDKPSKATKRDKKLAAWLKAGGEEKTKPNRRGLDKTESVMEGTWAIPDTPEKQERLEALLAQPLPLGVDGENATGALYDILGDDELFDELYSVAQEFGPEHDARMTIEVFIDKVSGYVGAERDVPGFTESLEEGEQLTDNVTNQLINRLVNNYPDVLKRHGSEYVYELVRSTVSFYTNDFPEDEGWGTSDSYGAWVSIADALGIDISRTETTETIDEDVVLPKATYSDYLDVYKSSEIGGTDTADDAKRMVKSLKKKGKDADEKAAKGALKRMAEQAAKTGLHMNETIGELEQLRRDAGIIK